MKLWIAFFVLIFEFCGLQTQAEVWTPQNTWNQKWEESFSGWVAKQVDLDIALNPAKSYYAQTLDCADFIYYLRALFSYENKLDFLALDDDKRPLSPAMTDFDQYPQELRVQKFIQKVLRDTNTMTLQRDSVTVAINRESIRPGTILITDKSQNHTWIVKSINASGVPYLLSATETVPPSSDIYPSMSFPSGKSAFARQSKFLSLDRGGFRRWLWPEELKHRNQVIFSKDQSVIPIDVFFETIQSRLALVAESPSEKLNRQLDELCLMVRIRTSLVTDAVLYQQDHRPWSAAAIDALSTNNRDQRIKDLILSLSYRNQNLVNISLDVRRKYVNFLKPTEENLNIKDSERLCLIQWAENRIEPLAHIVNRFSSWSSNPKDSLEERWAFVSPY